MSAKYAHQEYLAKTNWLADHLSDPDLRIFDCTVEMSNGPEKGYSVKNGLKKHEAGHIAGAAFTDLMGEFKDLDFLLYFMMPPADRFVNLASQFGIGDGVTVVFYNAGPTW